MKELSELELNKIDGSTTKLSYYGGKVLLIVNVASKCGFTSQYRVLEQLYRRYRNEGLIVMGFPCNQFGGQEPGTEREIEEFCYSKYGVTFPMFGKINVNGEFTHPLYQYLKKEKPGILGSGSIKWNFTKFLVDQEGKVIARYPSSKSPVALEKDILELLSHKRLVA